MALSASVLSSVEAWSLIISTLAIARLILCYFHNGLNKHDGPFLASFSDFWRLCHAYRNRNREPMIHIHEKYGDVVRMGPNVLSFRQPQAIRDIYGPGKHFKKSGYYPVNAAVAKGRFAHTLFSSPDQTWHNNLRRSIQSHFTMGAAVGYENLVETTIRVFLKEMDKRFAGKPGVEGMIDFHTWLLYFAFDVMGDLTYSARHGFIESGKDVNNIITYVKNFLSYGFIAGQMPTVDVCLRHNPVLMLFERREWIKSSTFPGVPFALAHMRKRQSSAETKGNFHTSDREDLLDKFLEAKRERPDVVTDTEVLGLSLSMMIAGAETTAITLTAFFYYLLHEPGCYSKLQDEVDTQLPPKDPNNPFYETRYADAHKLPYLHACIQEVFRMHPAFGFNYERIVPPAGATICGHFVPGGTVIGVNPWVVQRDKTIFGENTDQYRPERWLTDPERVNDMNRTMLHFGAGNHTCLGKNISAVEIYKIVPSLMRTFEISLEDPKKEWTLFNGANVRMTGVDIRINRR